jgi:hypothetical protein
LIPQLSNKEENGSVRILRKRFTSPPVQKPVLSDLESPEGKLKIQLINLIGIGTVDCEA